MEVGEVGRIDLHSHLLPRVDDGCGSLEDSLACVRRLKERGFAGTVCTPHYWMDEFPWNTVAAIEEAVGRLEEMLDEEGLEYRLWAGGEVRIAPGTTAWFEEHGVPTLGPGRCVLVDYWGSAWPEYGDEVIGWLAERDYQPVLAHPERMGLEDEGLERLLDRLAERGVWLQGNLKCIAGNEGPWPEQRMQRWLEAGRYRFVATDMHGTFDLELRLDGLAAVEAVVGSEALEQLIEGGPSAVVGDGGEMAA